MAAILPPLSAEQRLSVARRGTLLSRLTLAYNAAEGVLAIGSGILAGSIALVGFGADSVIEVASSVAAFFRLDRDADAARANEMLPRESRAPFTDASIA